MARILPEGETFRAGINDTNYECIISLILIKIIAIASFIRRLYRQEQFISHAWAIQSRAVRVSNEMITRLRKIVFPDQIRFYLVSAEELLNIRRDFPLGRYPLRIADFRTHQQVAFSADARRGVTPWPFTLHTMAGKRPVKFNEAMLKNP